MEHTGDEASEEGLVAEVLVVFLEMLFGRSDHLDGGKLVAGKASDETMISSRSTAIGLPSLLEFGDDVAD